MRSAGVPGLVFTPRTESNHVRLLGYAWPERGNKVTYVLHKPGRKVSQDLAEASKLLERADKKNYVLVAARVD